MSFSFLNLRIFVTVNVFKYFGEPKETKLNEKEREDSNMEKRESERVMKLRVKL